MLRVQGDDHAGELGPLRFMDRQDIGQGDLVEITEVVLHLPTLEVHHHFLLNPVDRLDHPEVAVENITIIVVFGLNYPVPKAKRPTESLNFWAAVAGDKLFFDMPPVEHAEHFIVEVMKKAGVDPAVIYAFEKTGLMVTEANEHLISDNDRAEWEEVVLEYRDKHGDLPEDDDNEWF